MIAHPAPVECILDDESEEDSLPLARWVEKSDDNTPLSHLKSETSIGGQSNTHGVSKDAITPTKKLPRRGSNKPLSHVGKSNTHGVPNYANTLTKKPLPHGGESNTHGVSSDVITHDKKSQRRGRRAEVTKTSLPHGESNTHGVLSHANKNEKKPETRGSKTTPLNDIETTKSAIDSEHHSEAESEAEPLIIRRTKKVKTMGGFIVSERNTHGVPSHASKNEKKPETRGSKTTRKNSFNESFDDAEINFNTPLNDIETSKSAIDSEHTFDADSKVSPSKRIIRKLKKEPVTKDWRTSNVHNEEADINNFYQ